jgi:hypothetical protein
MEKEIINLIEEKGPLIGSEIWEAVGGEGLILWRICQLSEKLIIRRVGTRYLRLDRWVEGFARLSPSIWREFLTYSVVGIHRDPNSVERRAQTLVSQIEEVSKAKQELAYHIVSALASGLDTELPLDDGVCFIIAGDVVYNMAHDIPRPERSTGKPVNGSDIDLVVIVDDHFPEDLMKKLDDAMYQEKSRLLITPHLKEEIDYIVKKLGRVREQVRFDSFRHMVACKILQEGMLLYGSQNLFGTVKDMLREKRVMEKLNDLEKRAKVFRKEAQEHILSDNPDAVKEESVRLFYPTEESEEFE